MYKYVHIPFCAKKCYYCDFTTFEGRHDISRYFAYLSKEAEMYERAALKTLYFGGGTPSVVDPECVNAFVAQEDLNDAEVTLEFNPESDLSNFEKYRGINRISIGIQTFNDQVLERLGRLHGSKRALEAYEAARRSFKNISVDLMFALPGQTMEMLKKDLIQLSSMEPDHISIYSLIWKEGTPFYSMKAKGLLQAAPEDLEAEMYEYIIDFLEDIGYEHYEVSSFAKNKMYSKHNLVYWKNEKYMGLGLGASGYLDNRYRNYKNFSNYYKMIDQGLKPVEEEESIDEIRSKEYEVILGLRLLKEGVAVPKVIDKHRRVLDEFVSKGLLVKDESYRLTRKGLFLLNEILTEII